MEYDFLTPEAMADYCYDRGLLQVGHRGGKESDVDEIVLFAMQCITLLCFSGLAP